MEKLLNFQRPGNWHGEDDVAKLTGSVKDNAPQGFPTMVILYEPLEENAVAEFLDDDASAHTHAYFDENYNFDEMETDAESDPHNPWKDPKLWRIGIRLSK